MIGSPLLLILMLLNTSVLSYYDDYFLPDSEDAQLTGKDKIPEYGEAEGPDRPTGYTCGLCIVVDDEFSKAYNVKDEKALKKFVQKFVDHANWVFRTVDWNQNGKPDNIGFRTSKISYGWKPYKKESTKNYETPKTAIQMLKIFARLNFSKCCLGVGFTNRPFTNGLDGISFGASDRLLGGICDHRNPHEEYMANMNVALISGRGLNKSQLTTYHIAKAFLHELGHAFGVDAHDNDYKDPQCWGFQSGERPPSQSTVPVDGRYIMWGKSPQSKAPLILQRNTLRFSACSKHAVTTILTKRKNRQKCFELDYNPFCGNGIVEGMEMCDCGNEYDCSQQKCCGSRKSDKPCTIDTKVCAVASRRRSNDNGSPDNKKMNWVMLIFYLVAALLSK